MDDQTPAFASIVGGTGVQEISEPLQLPLPNSNPPAKPSTTTTTSKRTTRDPFTKPAPRVQTRAASATNSPSPSREVSPIRPPFKPAARASTGPSRSRKNSLHDTSPSRSTLHTNNNPPSAAAIQRVLSSAAFPALPPAAQDSEIKAPVPKKLSLGSELNKETPRWPVSPRLRSPPPVNTRGSVTSPRKADLDLPSIYVQRNSPASEPTSATSTISANIDSETDDSLLAPGMRTPARGASGSTLETVQEISQPNTPATLTTDGTAERSQIGTPYILTEDNPIDYAFNAALKNKSSSLTNESGSDSGGKGEIKMTTPKVTPAAASRASMPTTKFSSTGRGKPSGEGPTRNMMTVETETVSSIPQIAVGGSLGGPINGSLRAKPSSETIRPKKEKKKARKAPSVTSGTGELHSSRPRILHHPSATWSTSSYNSAQSPERVYRQGSYTPFESSETTSPERPASRTSEASRRPSLNLYSVGAMLTRSRPASSKADIFEAKVASAVDEANSSDSEETFVYESNPPEPDRPRRFHSRTPSATSMVSQVDLRNGVRAMMDVGGHSVAMKKSMKFANSYGSQAPEMAHGDDDGRGTARSSMGTSRGTAHHHHIGRWGRNAGNGHPSLFDNESPFPNAAKSKFTNNNSRQSSRPTSPRVLNSRLVGNGKKTPISGYDFDDTADDERTPLIGTARSNRSSRIRRVGISRQLEHQASEEDHSLCSRFAGCAVLFVMIFLVILGASGFMFATTQALTDVKIVALKNVLASEQDIIVDMQVTAQNPNLVAVTIDTMDMVIFAKSKYAGTDYQWWHHPGFGKRAMRRRGGEIQTRDDDPIDPPLDKDPKDPTDPNLEVGHIYAFESPLIFEGSPFHHASTVSLGEMRVLKPGNHTEPRGSERWGRVLQHEFELIVRGTLKYTLPLSTKVRSIQVDGRLMVKPNAADQDPDAVHIIEG